MVLQNFKKHVLKILITTVLLSSFSMGARLTTLAASPKTEVIFPADLAVYVQGGSSADKTIYDSWPINPYNPDAAITKKADSGDGNFDRRAVLSFPITRLSAKADSYRLRLTLQKALGKSFTHVDVYQLSTVPDVSSLTWNLLLPVIKPENKILRIVSEDLKTGAADTTVEIDVTEVVERALAAGDKNLVLAFSIEEKGEDNYFSVYSTTAKEEKQPAILAELQEPLKPLMQFTSDAEESTYVQGGNHAGLTNSQYTNPDYDGSLLKVKTSDSNQAYTRKAYIRYGGLPYGAESIKSAEIILHKSISHPDWVNGSVYTMKNVDFDNTTATLNQMTPKEGSKAAVYSGENLRGNELRVDVTKAAKEMLEGGNSSLAFMLKCETEAIDNMIAFYSSRYGNKALRPAMELVYYTLSGMKDFNIETEVGIAPVLPDTIRLSILGGGIIHANIDWDTSSYKEEDYQKEGSFVVNGTLRDYEGYDLKAYVKVTSAKYQGKTYYVSNMSGDDNYNGLSEDQPWRSLKKVSETVFMPGDQILLKAGDVWNGQLKLRGSGVEGKPIIVDWYGGETRPVINGGGVKYAALRSAAVLLDNEEYWEINHLEVTNLAAGESYSTPKSLDYQRFGILVYTTDQEDIKDHIYVRDCYVHDVVSDKNVKMAGGILFVADSVTVDNEEVILPHGIDRAGHNDIRAERNIVRHVITEGIRNTTGATPRGSQNQSITCTNVVFRNNYIEGTLGDGIVLAQCREGGLVEKNVVKDAASAFNNGAYYAGVWAHKSTDTIFQYNEVSGTRFGNKDGEAFDADNNCYGTIFQYNYTHDNNGGACLFMGTQHGTIYRYNVSANDGYKAGEEILNDHSNPNNINSDRVPQIYNNTFYVDKNKNTSLYGYTSPGVCNFQNNIILASESAAAGGNMKFSKAKTGEASIIRNNCFLNESIFEVNRPALDKLKAEGNIFTDPMLTAPEFGKSHDTDVRNLEKIFTDPLGELRSRVSIYSPKAGSPVLGAGISIRGNNLTEDIMGFVIPDCPAMGAVQEAVN